jgi:hypothetical protein
MASRWRGCLVGRTRVSAQKGHKFWSDCWIALKFLQGFQSLFSLVMIWNRSSVTRMSGRQLWVSAQKAQKGCNFWYDCWIVFKFLQGFPKAIFLGVVMEWLLGDEDVWSGELEYRLKRVLTFDATVGSCSNFYRGFESLFWLVMIWNRCLETRMSGANLEYRLKTTITFDSTVWSRSNIYRGFQRLFSVG